VIDVKHQSIAMDVLECLRLTFEKSHGLVHPQCRLVDDFALVNGVVAIDLEACLHGDQGSDANDDEYDAANQYGAVAAEAHGHAGEKKQ
jgi:hypothetical protein